MPIGVYPRGEFSDAEFFEQRVTRTNSCWLWVGSKYKNGYGWARKQYAHRLSWKLHRGEIPKGKWVLHTCDTRLCVNPAHLYVGHGKENTRDARERSRYPGGAKSSRARVSAADVREMRALRSGVMATLSEMEASRQLAERYGLKFGGAKSILRGLTWRHVKPEVRT